MNCRPAAGQTKKKKVNMPAHVMLDATNKQKVQKYDTHCRSAAAAHTNFCRTVRACVRACVCVFTSVRIHTYMHTQTHTYVHAYLPLAAGVGPYMQPYMCPNTHKHTFIQTYTYAIGGGRGALCQPYMCQPYMCQPYMCPNTHIFMHTYTHSYQRIRLLLAAMMM